MASCWPVLKLFASSSDEDLMKTRLIVLGTLAFSFSALAADSGVHVASYRAPVDSFGEESEEVAKAIEATEPAAQEKAHAPAVAEAGTKTKTKAEEADDEAAPASAPAETLARIERSLHTLEERMTTRKATLRTKDWEWEELSHFQRSLWRAMALDPAQVSENLIPAHIHPRALTEQLRTELDRLVHARVVAEKYNVTEEFDAYVDYCREILAMREDGLFRQSRIDTKRGGLENRYFAITEKLAQSAGAKVELGVAWDEGDRRDILASLSSVRDEIHEFRNDVMRLPASVVPTENFSNVKTLFWILIPLVFATGFLGGLVFRKSE